VARKSKNTNNGATLGFEETLWQAAQTDHEKSLIQRQIDTTDKQID